jgi:hypothetical protein
MLPLIRRRYCWAGFRRGANTPAVSILWPNDALLKDDFERAVLARTGDRHR